MKMTFQRLISGTALVCTLGFAVSGQAQQCGEPPRRFTDYTHPGGPRSFRFECHSTDGCFKICELDPRNEHPYITDARLRSHTPDTKCEEGVDWGYQGMGTLWVDHGCKGTFEVYTH